MLRDAKRFLVIDRPQLWFETMWNNVMLFDELHDYWREEVRFSKKTFRYIVDILLMVICKEWISHFERPYPLRSKCS